jgi:hypothetical protein
MSIFAVQYLGSRPKEATPEDVLVRLREACRQLPISLVLLDWEVSPPIEEAVAQESASTGVELYRWQTWLTGDSHAELPPEWAVVGLDGNPVAGFDDDIDFTFICPNHSGVEDFLAERLESIAARGLYSGIFLDRIRFPSPAQDLPKNLGCFCKDCARIAADMGFDLESARQYILSLLDQPQTALELVQRLLDGSNRPPDPLTRFLDFREHSLTRVIRQAQQAAALLGLKVGLDCFSPSLARMVGQNIPDLSRSSDWIKIMTYPRVWGPAGISFELLSLVDWLLELGLKENEIFQALRVSSRLPVPSTRAELVAAGLPSSAIRVEIDRGRPGSTGSLLAGIALVDVKTIHESTEAQIESDIRESLAADGLVLSWDLWQIPPRRLETIHQIWESS